MSIRLTRMSIDLMSGILDKKKPQNFRPAANNRNDLYGREALHAALFYF